MKRRRKDDCVKKDLSKIFRPPTEIAELSESEKAYFDALIESHKQRKDGSFIIGGKVFAI